MTLASRSLTVRVLARVLVKGVSSAALLLLCAAGATAQAPPTIDTSAIGPKVGAHVPPFEGTDQFGRRQTLESSVGEKGAMLVFFRSADW